MVKIGLLSDTHSFLDERVFKYFAEVDEIWHAGDIGNLHIADKIEAFKPLRAVWGNIDGKDARLRFSLDLRFEIAGLSVFMTHIGGYPNRYLPRVRQLFDEWRLQNTLPKLYICGHSHILKVMPDPKYGFLHINPGAAGNEGFHKVKTLIRFEIEDGKIRNLEVIELS